ncbi:hypothetical protein MMC16_001276 [Acarospora aff. strigata]|nr:hypothetical protein [Acarospora aff. strigata]
MESTVPLEERNLGHDRFSSTTLESSRHDHEVNVDATENGEKSNIDDQHGIRQLEKSKSAAVRKVVSRTRSASSWIDPGPPPDGGLGAWVQVLMGHLVVFNSWGYINSFGVFQTYYVTALNQSPSAISWVGSVQIFLLFFVGTFSGRATDAGYFRITIAFGSFFQLLGVFMTSLCTKYWQLFLAQGLCTGLGNGLLFCPTLSLMSTYFSKKRSLAIGIAASGSATGGLVFPAIVQQLLPRIGFPWTVRVLAFVMLVLQAVTLAFTRTRLPPRRSGPLVEWAAFKELPYLLFSIGMFLNFWGLYFAFYYVRLPFSPRTQPTNPSPPLPRYQTNSHQPHQVGSFGRTIIHLTATDSITLLLIMNGVGLFGRLIPNHAADTLFGPLNTLIPIVLISSLLLYAWAAVHHRAALLAFSAVYGLFAAGIQSLFPATLSSLTTDLKKAGVRMGMVFSVVSFACLTGPPLAGVLVQRGDGRYLYAQLFAGSVMLAGCVTLVGARVARTGWRFRVRM